MINAASHRDTEQKDISAQYVFDNPENDLINLNATVYHEDTYVLSRRYSDNRRDETDASTTGLDIFNTSNFVLGENALGYGLNHALTYGFETYVDKQDGKRNGGPRPLLGDAKQTVLGFYTQDEIGFGQKLTVYTGYSL